MSNEAEDGAEEGVGVGGGGGWGVELVVYELDCDDAVLERLGVEVGLGVLGEVGGAEAEDCVGEVLVLNIYISANR